jgi:replicative DNA helicase
LDYTDKYTIVDDDFTDDFHKIIFGSIYKLHELGAERITLNSIADYLSSRPKSEAIFIKQKGEEWLIKASENAEPASFDYYYNRMKKMTLLRMFDLNGISVKDIYDPDNIIDLKKRQE